MNQTNAFAPCPQCGGHTELDEDGHAYTCYFCCDTGIVEASVAAAHLQAEIDRAEQFRPSRNGIYLKPGPFADEDEYEPQPGYRLFTRLLPRAPRIAYASASTVYDEIPF